MEIHIKASYQIPLFELNRFTFSLFVTIFVAEFLKRSDL